MPNKEYNILILGAPGVGKSTFINAFSNYINFPTLDDALKAKEIHAFIPSKFIITDVTSKSQTIEIGMDKNESFEAGKSATQSCRLYSFEADEITIRLIDTPSIGDTDGVIKEQENFTNLLYHLRGLSKINAVIIMLKPNEYRLTVFLKYCMKQLLFALERSAINNVIFLFTNSRGNVCNLDHTIHPLRQILNKIKEISPYLDVLFVPDNTFCMDNEGFRYLLAQKQGHKFSECDKQSFQNSWDNSLIALKRLLQYVSTLKPYHIQSTISIMDAKRLSSEPLGDILLVIENHLNKIKRLEVNLKEEEKIAVEESAKDRIQKDLKGYRCERMEWEKEKEIIQRSLAKFAHFLSNCASIPFNDIYEEYLNKLIKKEKDLVDQANQDTIANYENLKAIYESHKEILVKELKNIQLTKGNITSVVEAPEIVNIIKELCDLKHFGNIIKEMCDYQRKNIDHEIIKNTEKVVKPIQLNNEDKFFFSSWIQPVNDNQKKTSIVKKECNILLLGETGVGKSTFINAFSNYLNFPTLDDALEADKIHALIPSKFTITDETSFDSRMIEFGMDKNESFETGKSSTQACRAYTFATKDVAIRLIDTPGIGDTGGVTKDQENFSNLLEYLSEFREINAIILMLKPNEARLTVFFEYCIKQLLSSLERTAVDNIVFLFTNSRATFYRPGDTVGPLRKVLKEIKGTPPNVDIRFEHENTFCMDSEAFRFLLATRQGCVFSERVKQSFYDSWQTSVIALKRLLQYVETLKPHRIQNTISVMDARRSIERLRKPLSEISVLIENNLNRIKRLEENLLDTSRSIDDLKQFLCVPRINLKVVEYPYPRTVCTHENCTEPHTISDVTSYHYKQVCHDPCYLSGVPRNITGDERLQCCSAMTLVNGMKICNWKECGHSFLHHMHVYYTTEPYEESAKDLHIENKITTKEGEKELIQKELTRYQGERIEFEKEKDIIQKAVAKFAHFLSNNVIIPYNDAYKEYLYYLIEKERNLGNLARPQVIANYESLIAIYESEKEILMEELKNVQAVKKDITSIVEAPEIMNIVKELYGLKFSGKIIKRMYDAQQRLIEHEIVRKTERIIKPIPVKRGHKNNWKNKLGDMIKYFEPIWSDN